MKKDAGPRPRVVRLRPDPQSVQSPDSGRGAGPSARESVESPDSGTGAGPHAREPLRADGEGAPAFEAAGDDAQELTGHLAHAFKDAADAAANSQGASLTVEDEKLFRAFQNNLLSLISHELRTPLMGVQNGIQGIEDTAGEAAREWVQMAKRNAQRLSRTLQGLIDLASIEGGTFHVRLREMDLFRFTSSFLERSELGASLQERKLECRLERSDGRSAGADDAAPLLADPAKFGRALELLVASIAGRAEVGSVVTVKVEGSRIEVEFELDAKFKQIWETAWTQAMTAHHSGHISSASAFGGAVQTEEAFLTRSEEGLGNEFILIHQILKLHNGRFEAEKLTPARVRMRLVLPELSSEEGLLSVLVSRLHEHAPESGALGAVGLALIAVPEGDSVGAFRTRVHGALHRSTDAVYPLHSRKQVAIVLNDCRAADGPKLLARVAQTLGLKEVRSGYVAAPEDGVDPYALLELALKRMRGL